MMDSDEERSQGLKKMNVRIVQRIILSIAVLLFSACESLPEGNPPEGPIVTIENAENQPMSLKTATDQMITALATSAELTKKKDKVLPNIIPGSAIIPENYKTQLAMSSINVYSELLIMRVLDTDLAKPADYTLSSSFVKLVKTPPEFNGRTIFKWEMSLTKIGASKPDWTYCLKVFLD